MKWSKFSLTVIKKSRDWSFSRDLVNDIVGSASYTGYRFISIIRLACEIKSVAT
jgi:hypothetical protein